MTRKTWILQLLVLSGALFACQLLGGGASQPEAEEESAEADAEQAADTGEEAPEETVALTQTHVAEEGGYSLDLPDGWVAQSFFGITLAAPSQATLDAAGGGELALDEPLVSVLVGAPEDFGGPFDSPEAMAVSQVESDLATDVNVTTSDPASLTVGGLPAAAIDYSATDAATGLELAGRVVTVMGDGRAGLISGFSAAESWPDFAPTFDAIVASVVFAEGAAAPASGATGLIAFQSAEGDNTDIYVANADGSGVTRLTDDPGVDRYPGWSPDGSRIVFQSERSGNSDVFVMDADGSNVVQLTTDAAGDYLPTWSPDGTRIAFGSRRSGDFELFVMDADGANARQLTFNGGGLLPANWSPDSARLAFVAPVGTDYEVFTVGADGSDMRQLTSNEKDDMRPEWSPDGSQLLFESNRDGNWEVYVMSADGSNVVRLTEREGGDGGARWSPNGTRIAYEAEEDSNDWDLHLMNADGSDARKMHDDSGDSAGKSWSPDGRFVAFHSNADGDFDIYALDVESGEVLPLTDNQQDDFLPVWQPGG